jgi:hypothetical protein
MFAGVGGVFLINRAKAFLDLPEIILNRPIDLSLN